MARWLNELLTQQRPNGSTHLTVAHVFVQMIIFFLLLVFPLAVQKTVWAAHLPELFFFAGSLFYICKEQGYRLTRGAVLFNSGRPWEVLYRVASHRVLGGRARPLLSCVALAPADMRFSGAPLGERLVEADVVEHRP